MNSPVSSQASAIKIPQKERKFAIISSG